jgi:hypothetical protein
MPFAEPRPVHANALGPRRLRGRPMPGPCSSAGRRDRRAQRRVRGEHALIARQMHSRGWHQRREPVDEVEQVQNTVCRSISIHRFQTVPHLPLRREIEPLDGHRRTTHVAREPLELLPLLPFHRRARVQREPRVLRDPFPRLVHSRRHGL